jgi:hypothetical protein
MIGQGMQDTWREEILVHGFGWKFWREERGELEDWGIVEGYY